MTAPIQTKPTSGLNDELPQPKAIKPMRHLLLISVKFILNTQYITH